MGKRGPEPMTTAALRKRWARRIQQYEAGHTVREIAAQEGVTFQAVHNTLQRCGITLRRFGPRSERKPALD